MSRPAHFDIHASDPQAVMDFYGNVFGWTFQQFGEDEYWLVTTGDAEEPGIDGGIFKRVGPAPSPDAPAMGATLYMLTDNLDETSGAIVDAGGQQVVEKFAVPGVGWSAHFKDPDGNAFGLFQNDAEAA